MQNKQTLSKPLVVMLLAGLCCLLWGSAIPFINLGYRYFGVSAGDTATQILFGGCRFFLAGFLTILFESVARKSPAFPKRTSWGNVVKLSLAQTIIQYVFFYIGVAHTASAKGAIIQGLQAFTSILIACFIFRTERMNALKWIGGLIGVAGVVVVTSPQELVGMIVDKAVNMADMMHVPVLGIVENMAYYTCPDCGKQHAIFGESHIEAIAAKHGIPNTAKLPIDPAIAAACDAGKIEDVQGDWLSSLADAIEGK